jgi:hypothetical protein
MCYFFLKINEVSALIINLIQYFSLIKKKIFFFFFFENTFGIFFSNIVLSRI